MVTAVLVNDHPMMSLARLQLFGEFGVWVPGWVLGTAASLWNLNYVDNGGFRPLLLCQEVL